VKRELTVSIVIPVYNEQHHIKACLDGVMNQTVKPLEVIVVDNNCTDNTITIVHEYPNVKVVKETTQGRGAARTAGFNEAKASVIGRIDADSILAPNWVELVTADFSDDSVMGVTGLGKTNIIPFPSTFYVVFWSRVYFWVTHAYFDAVTMWGANMAIRQTMWRKVRREIMLDDTLVHEDQDLSLMMLSKGGKIIQDNNLLVETPGLSYFYWPKFWEYFTRSMRTKHFHERKGTLSDNNSLRIGFWKALPGAIIGWFFGVIFIIGSFVAWPLNATVHTRLKYR
jgi:glycosyltransferase involved in cell wall biosynthesis